MLMPQQSRQFDDLEGVTIQEGRFIIQRRVYLAQKMGRCVYQGYDNQTEKLVAIKVFQRSQMRENDLKLFHYEIEVMQKVRSDHVVNYVSHQDIKAQSKLYIVMDFCKGEDMLKHLNRVKKPLSESQALTYLIQIFKALYALHKQGFAHRDLKLENIMLEDGKVILIDFGFSKRMFGDSVQGYLTNTLVGTQIYIAPEVLLQQQYNPFKSDIYSLGVILYTATQLKYPYDPPANMSREGDKHLAETIRLRKPVLNQEVSPQFKELIFSMMEYDPQKRITHSQILKNRLITDLLAVGNLRCNGALHLPSQQQLEEYFKFYVDQEQKYEAKTEEQFKQIIHISLPRISEEPNLGPEEEDQRADYNQYELAEKKSIEILELSQQIQNQMIEYEHNLNVLIWMTKVFFLYQSNQPRFQQQVVVAALLFKMIMVEYQQYRHQLETDQNIFKIEQSLFQKLINHEDYKKHKKQILQEYYPIIEIHINLLLPEFIQVLPQQSLIMIDVDEVSQIQNLLAQQTQELLESFKSHIQKEDPTTNVIVKQYIADNIKYYATLINPRQYFKVLRQEGNFDFLRFQSEVEKKVQYTPEVVTQILSQTNKSVVLQLQN